MELSSNSINKVTLAIILLCLTFKSIDAVVITDCSEGENPDATLGTVGINGCSEGDDDCALVRGKNSTITVDFTSVKSFNNARIAIAGKIGVWMPFLIKPDEACGNYGFDCPVNANEKKRLTISLPIMRTYPKMKLNVRLQMFDENKHLILCTIIPARIVDPARKPR